MKYTNKSPTYTFMSRLIPTREEMMVGKATEIQAARLLMLCLHFSKKIVECSGEALASTTLFSERLAMNYYHSEVGDLIVKLNFQDDGLSLEGLNRTGHGKARNMMLAQYIAEAIVVSVGVLALGRDLVKEQAATPRLSYYVNALGLVLSWLYTGDSEMSRSFYESMQLPDDPVSWLPTTEDLRLPLMIRQDGYA